MFDAKKLLDQVIGGLDGRKTGGASMGNSLGDTAQRMLGQLTGGGAAAGPQTGSRGAGVETGGLATGALAGGALGLLLGSKKARKMAGKLGGTAVTAGGLALVAGLAYKAWTSYQQQQGQAVPAPAQGQAAGSGPVLLPPPSDSPFHPDAAPGGHDARARDLLVAMIAAAKADGHIDAAEQQQIFERLDGLSLDSEAKAFVMDELRSPLDIERVVRLASDPAAAAEIYAASLLAMDPDTPAERAYLDLLAARLGLAKDLAAEIERSTAAALSG